MTVYGGGRARALHVPTMPVALSSQVAAKRTELDGFRSAALQAALA